MKPSPTTTQNLHYQPLWLASLLALMLMLAVSSGEAAVRATLDRDTLYAGDTFTLTIESDSRQSNLQPNLSPLEKDFEVLGTSTSTQVSIFNGQRADKTLWQVQLQPRHSGQLSIPPLMVGGQQTAPVELKVTEAPQQTTAQAGQHVFIEAEVNSASKQTYVQQQIPYTVRLYYDGRLQEGELNAPKLQNAVVEQLGEDKSYSVMRNGHPYNVIERHYVISPEKSGALHIPPATFSGRIAVASQAGRSQRPGSMPNNMMEQFLKNSPFANDPFFHNSLLNNSFFTGGPFGNPGKPIAARSRAINMGIKPRPVTAGRNWLPAEAVTLLDSWTKNPPQFKVGEPVSRTITIQTKGLSGSQIPELAIAAPANTRLYPETQTQESHTDGKTVYGVRTQTLTYIAGAQRTLKVPAITLKWWDSRHNRAASTILPAWQFKVLPGAAGTTAVPPPASHHSAVQQGTSTTASPVSKAAPANGALGMIPEVIKANWLWLVIGSGVLLALVLLLARRTKRHHQMNTPSTAKPAPQATHPAKANQKSALQALGKACTANDRRAAASALLNLGHAHWPDDPPRSLNALAARVIKGQVQLRALDRSLYAADTTDWNGAALWNEFRHGLQEKPEVKHDHHDGLNPLYPQHS